MSSQALSSNKVFFGLVQFHWGKVFDHVIIFHDVSDVPVILFYIRKENETFLKGVYFDIKYSSLTIMILVVVHNY